MTSVSRMLRAMKLRKMPLPVSWVTKARPPLPPPHRVDGDVPGDGQQPSPAFRIAGRHRIEKSPGPQHRLLKQILGRERVAGEPDQETQHRIRMIGVYGRHSAQRFRVAIDCHVMPSPCRPALRLKAASGRTGREYLIVSRSFVKRPRVSWVTFSPALSMRAIQSANAGLR